jgi:hypothetical protein
MAPETCAVCGNRYPFDSTVHVLVHTNGAEGVLEYYVCENCYEAELESALV